MEALRTSGTPDEHLAVLDVLADQLEAQAAHLSSLAKGELFVPLDLSGAVELASRRRRLLAAIAERTRKPSNPFMSGPEPSWVRKQQS